MNHSLANKQDQRSAISTEHELKRQLEIEKLKTKYKIVSSIFFFERIQIYLRNYVRHYQKIIKLKQMNPFGKVLHG